MRNPPGRLVIFAGLLFLPSTLLAQAQGQASTQLDSRPTSPDPSLQLTPSETVLYESAPTVIAWTPQRIRDCPTLRKLRPAKSQDQLPMILERAGQTGTKVFSDFPQISCDEEVTSDTSGAKTHSTKTQKFRYIVIPLPAGDVRMFEEYRTDLEGNPAAKMNLGDLYMITSGFASSWLYLSPAEQRDNSFRHFGIQTIRNRECHVVAFAQDPLRARRVGAVRIGDKDVVLLVQGLAWIDTRTFQILRVMTWLLVPRTDVNLRSLTSTVDSCPVQPVGSERSLWLPCDVKVWVLYRGSAIRNTHHYSNFKLFRVESTIIPVE